MLEDRESAAEVLVRYGEWLAVPRGTRTGPDVTDEGTLVAPMVSDCTVGEVVDTEVCRRSLSVLLPPAVVLYTVGAELDKA